MDLITKAKTGNKQAIRELYELWLADGGSALCLSCGGVTQRLINHMEMRDKKTDKWILKTRGQIRIAKGDPRRISNATMTQDLAIAYLKEDLSRIYSFRSYPDNWKELVGVEEPTEPIIQPTEPIIQPTEPIIQPADSLITVAIEGETPCMPCWKDELLKWKQQELFRLAKERKIKLFGSIRKPVVVDIIIADLIKSGETTLPENIYKKLTKTQLRIKNKKTSKRK